MLLSRTDISFDCYSAVWPGILLNNVHIKSIKGPKVSLDLGSIMDLAKGSTENEGIGWKWIPFYFYL